MSDHELDLPTVNDRLELLYVVLQYCTFRQDWGKPRVFTPGERIAINQERGALDEYISYLFGTMPREAVRRYHIPEAIEEKIKWCIQMMAKEGFQANDRSEYLEHLKKY
jgi:hypothetical protein